MSDVPTPPPPVEAPGPAASPAVEAGHAHNPHVAHHFHSMKQQFSTEKLGIWLFLATEILMFGGLFCAYGVYRGLHSELFLYGHQFLDTKWGAINTAVLLTSSLTMAWAVRAAQINAQGALKVLLALTFLGGIGFMVIKGIEYQAKFAKDLWPGQWNLFYPVDEASPLAEDLRAKQAKGIHKLEDYYIFSDHGKATHGDAVHHTGDAAYTTADVDDATPATTDKPLANVQLRAEDQSTISAPAVAAGGVDATFLATGEAHAGHHYLTFEDLPELKQDRMHMFFQIYFLMTGLHGLHVVIGMGLIGWVFLRATQGAYSSESFAAVDVVGLYWHLVDLIWIFLFPLLYLIH